MTTFIRFYTNIFFRLVTLQQTCHQCLHVAVPRYLSLWARFRTWLRYTHSPRLEATRHTIPIDPDPLCYAIDASIVDELHKAYAIGN